MTAKGDFRGGEAPWDDPTAASRIRSKDENVSNSALLRRLSGSSHGASPPRESHVLGATVFWLLLTVLGLIFVAPIVWMFLTSLKTQPESTSVPPTILPDDPTLSAYNEVLQIGGSYPVLLDSRVGGSQVIAQNGNRFVGVGHHAFVTDLSGQEHMLYHGIDRNNAWLNEPGGVNRRPTLIDRLDWIDDWPQVRAGAGPSEEPVPAPVTTTGLGIDRVSPAFGSAFAVSQGTFDVGTDDAGDGGSVGRLVPDSSGSAVATTRQRAPREVRMEADVRFADAGTFTAGFDASTNGRVDVDVDTVAGELRVSSQHDDQVTSAVAPLPDGYSLQSWTVLTVDLGGGEVTARLSESGLGDVVAEATTDVADGAIKQRPVSLTATDGEVEVDNLSIVPAHRPVTEAVPQPQAGEPLFADEFDDELAEGWSWVRPDDFSGEVADGALQWPLASADLHTTTNTGALLLRDAPANGEWIAETKLDLDLGTDTIRNYQQAGLLVYVDDDNYLRMGSLASWGTRQVEFAKEFSSPGGRIDFGGHLGGPAAPTMWLRIHHSVSGETGEHLYRSATSVDGTTWRWGATWTMPADTSPKLGLYAGGGAEPAVTAAFDSFTFYAVD